MTEFDIGYFAGLLDGEGFVTITCQGTTTQGSAAVGITNMNKPLLEELKRNFGGIIYDHGKPTSVRHKQGYVWRLNGKKVEPFLTLVLPHLRLKKRQAELTLIFIETVKAGGPGRDTTNETLILRDEIREEVRTLNKRGTELCV